MATALPDVNGFELRRLIGRGGSASVYEAFDPRHGRPVAIKVIDVRRFDGSRRRAFTRELRAMGRLGDHPHVVNVFDSGFTDDDLPFLVMPLLQGGTLDDRLERDGALPIVDALHLGVRIASALETAHRRGILHCDLKPSNLFYGPYDTPMVGDFGISSVAYAGVTTTQQLGVTVRYAAPEVLDDEDPTARSDIYSLGATLFALIEGAPPFSGESPTAVVKEIFLNDRSPRLSVTAPEGLADLLQEMTSVDPAARPKSMAEVAERLQSIEAAEGLSVTHSLIGDAGDRLIPPPIPDGTPTVVETASVTALADLEVTQVDGVEPDESPSRTPLLAALALLLIGGIAGALLLWPSGSDGPEVEVAGEVEERVASTTSVEDDEPTNSSTSVAQTTSSIADAIGSTTSSADPERAVSLSDDDESTADAEIAEVAAPTTVALTTAAPATTQRPTTTTTTRAPTTTTTATPAATSQLLGVITDTAGAGVSGVVINLFSATGNPEADPVSKRGDFLRSVETNANGRYLFEVDPGCYVVGMLAPDGDQWAGGASIIDVGLCAEQAATSARSDQQLAKAAEVEASLTGIVLAANGAPVVGLKVDLFLTNDAGERSSFVATTNTGSAGGYRHEVAPGCYKLTFVAPEGSLFPNGTMFENSPELCLSPGGAATANTRLG